MRQSYDFSSIRGITLLEMLVTLAILAIAATIATPALTQVIHNNRIASQNNELVALISLAKSQAVRRNSDYVVEFATNAESWGAYLNRQLTAVAPTNGDDGLDPTCSEDAVRCAEHGRVALSVDSNGDALTFDQRGYLRPLQARTLALQHVPCQGERQRRVITITATGQISSESAPCN